jgi:hypothetical protein
MLATYGISWPLTVYSVICSPRSLNFVAHHTQQTKVDIAMSGITDLASVVVQGSVIWPQSFPMFNNDVIAVLTEKDFACQLSVLFR